MTRTALRVPGNRARPVGPRRTPPQPASGRVPRAGDVRTRTRGRARERRVSVLRRSERLLQVTQGGAERVIPCQPDETLGLTGVPGPGSPCETEASEGAEDFRIRRGTRPRRWLRESRGEHGWAGHLAHPGVGCGTELNLSRCRERACDANRSHRVLVVATYSARDRPWPERSPNCGQVRVTFTECRHSGKMPSLRTRRSSTDYAD